MKIEELIEKWVNAPCGCGLESDCKCADLQILAQCLKVVIDHADLWDATEREVVLAEIERLAGGE